MHDRTKSTTLRRGPQTRPYLYIIVYTISTLPRHGGTFIHMHVRTKLS